ncbi:MAG: TolC family protein [Gemmatimonadaceae bacterium]
MTHLRLHRARARRATLSIALVAVAPLGAQQPASTGPITRAGALSLALASGGRAAIAGATARIAAGNLLAARALTNPAISASRSTSFPEYHAAVDIPLDFLTIRSLRIAAATSANEAARLRLAFETAAVRVTVDTLYTRAVASAARAGLSHRNAVAAESLLAVARVRRDAGDASDLDVELAVVNAGQAEIASASDSLGGIGALLDLQATLGVASREPVIALADSVLIPSPDSLSRLAAAAESAVEAIARAGAMPLNVAASERDLRAAEQALALERRSVWSGFAVSAGGEWRDPGQPGFLPTIGISIPLPLFNRHQGEIAVAAATRDRARAELALARVEGATAIAQARRQLQVAVVRAQRDRDLVASADRVARMSLQAYAEGAYPLTSVLEAQRNARETLAQYIADVAAVHIAAATLRLYAFGGDEPLPSTPNR